MPKIVFRTDKLESLPLPSKGKVYFFDTKQPGLALVVTPTNKSFYLMKFANGMHHRKMLGRFPCLRLEDARNIVAEAMADIARGHRPKLHTDTLLISSLWAQYARYKRKDKSSYSVFSYYKNHIEPAWGRRTIGQLSKIELQNWVIRVGETSGRHTANKVLSIFSAMLNWGLRNEIIFLDSNPAKFVKKYKLQPRDRFLQPGEEMDRFLAEVNKATPLLRDYILMALCTGARKTNVLEMRWQDINFQLRSWTIPGEQFKNGITQTIHLSDQALEILKRRRQEIKDSPWVFPSDTKSGHLDYPGSSFRRIAKRAKVEDLRIHDLRRTLASYMAINGTPLPHIAHALGHRDMRSTQVYARLTFDPIRQAVDRAQPFQ